MTSSAPGVAIIGSGGIGRKRARALCGAPLRACIDANLERAEALAATVPDAVASTQWQDALRRDDVGIVIVCATNDVLADAACEALASGKHVLIEKPAGRTVAELDRIQAAAAAHHRLVRIGFNHRYHPAIVKAKAIVDAGAVGPLMMIRGRYGHGGRVGYDREWRANPEISGGGELIDQGVHLIDLSRWFFGAEFASAEGFAATFYWDMPVDDNAFLTLRTSTGATAFLHVSCSEWKNLFSLEIYGRTGKLHVDGLGGSYGVEKLTWFQMRPEMGPPDVETWEYPGPDTSWEREFQEFLDDIAADRQPAAGLTDARSALEVVEEIYRRSRQPAEKTMSSR
jgi:predicted dehydrogenase